MTGFVLGAPVKEAVRGAVAVRADLQVLVAVARVAVRVQVAVWVRVARVAVARVAVALVRNSVWKRLEEAWL